MLSSFPRTLTHLRPGPSSVTGLMRSLLGFTNRIRVSLDSLDHRTFPRGFVSHHTSNTFSKCFLLDCPDHVLSWFRLPMTWSTLEGDSLPESYDTGWIRVLDWCGLDNHSAVRNTCHAGMGSGLLVVNQDVFFSWRFIPEHCTRVSRATEQGCSSFCQDFCTHPGLTSWLKNKIHSGRELHNKQA